jgi:dual oxidase
MDSYANDLIKVMQTSLTKNEFASALDMKPNDLFVIKMFRVVDKDGDGRISFQVKRCNTLRSYCDFVFIIGL